MCGSHYNVCGGVLVVFEDVFVIVDYVANLCSLKYEEEEQFYGSE